MNLLILGAVSIAGGIGAVLRYLIDQSIAARLKQGFPWGTALVNLSGSFLAGILLGIGPAQLPQPWANILIAGFLGGYTTFSTASLETVQLLTSGNSTNKQTFPALLYSAGMLIGSVACALAGIHIFR